jgi:DNA-binding CsgD family transcriptional regulator
LTVFAVDRFGLVERTGLERRGPPIRISTYLGGILPSINFFSDEAGREIDVPRTSSTWSGEPVRTGFISGGPAARVLPLPAPVQVARQEERPRPPRYSWADWSTDRRVERDRQKVLHLLDDVTAVDEPTERVRCLLRLLADLLHADACAFTQLDFAARHRTTLGWPVAAPTTTTPPPAGPPVHETQQLTPAEYRELFAVLGTPYQLAIPLRLDGSTAVACAAGRDHFPFLTDEEGLAVVLQLAIAPLRLSVAPTEPPATGNRSLLTLREQDVLTQLAAGATARAIANRLRLSPRTVCKHLEHIYAKLGVSDRLSAVSQAHALGLLPLPVRRTDPAGAWSGPAATPAPVVAARPASVSAAPARVVRASPVRASPVRASPVRASPVRASPVET